MSPPLSRSIPLALGALSLGLLVGCGGAAGRSPGLHPGDVLYWRLLAIDTRFTECGDSPELASELDKSRLLRPGDDLVVQVAEDGEAANWLTCATDDPYTCVRRTSDPVFAISGVELRFERETRSSVENSGGCTLLVSEAWLLVDRGPTLEVSISRTHRLVDAPSSCLLVDQEYRAGSTNGRGIDGCVAKTEGEARID